MNFISYIEVIDIDIDTITNIVVIMAVKVLASNLK